MARTRRLIKPASEVVEADRSGLQWVEASLGHVKELSDRVTELSTLMGVSTLLSSDRPLTEVLDSVCRLTAEICKAQVAFIHLADGEDDLVCVARHYPEDSRATSWEGFARIYSRKAIQKESISSCPILVLHGEAEPRPTGEPRMGGICAVPLRGKTRAVGALAVGYAGPHRFSAREKDMLNAVAAQLAMAVERSWLFDRLQEQLARANSLREVATRIGSNLQLDRVLDSIVDHASRLLAAEFSAIFLVDEPRNRTPLSEGRGLERGRDPGAALQLDDGPLASAVHKAVESASPALVHTALQDEGEDDSPTDGSPADYQSVLAVPLLSGQDVLGALVTCYEEKRHFDPSDVSLAEDFAGQAALAIRNARLYQEAMEDRLSLEDALNQISNHGISLLDEKLNITFANPATFWMLGASPKCAKMSLEEWSTLLKRSAANGSELDQAVEQVLANPEETVEVRLAARGSSSAARTLRLISYPFRHEDGSIRGRVNLLEEVK